MRYMHCTVNVRYSVTKKTFVIMGAQHSVAQWTMRPFHLEHKHDVRYNVAIHTWSYVDPVSTAMLAGMQLVRQGIAIPWCC